MATTAAHAGTGALLREEQDQFLQREYFALLISEAACCHCCVNQPPPTGRVFAEPQVCGTLRVQTGGYRQENSELIWGCNELSDF